MKSSRVKDRTELNKLAKHLESNLENGETLIWKNDFCFDIWKHGKVFKRYIDQNYDEKKT